ncbi:MAG: hypothetical protein BRD30_01670 [Bacteroidetes bacterium QH_2_63_10]|nr:MAG: hypothetical protein BRD30_01670 [Bacteroidetes bacterium QH_2_63_10]
MRTYADQPMSSAEAGLVCMAEAEPSRSTVTTDDDFHVYRAAGDEPLDVVFPGSSASEWPILFLLLPAGRAEGHWI